LRIVIISDTHGKHAELGDLSGDVLIHCGDFCNGYMNDGHSLSEIDDWFGEQAFDLILCVGGNHDFAAELRHASGMSVFRNAIYLVLNQALPSLTVGILVRRKFLHADIGWRCQRRDSNCVLGM
jgi:predicted phosphodiesterase